MSELASKGKGLLWALATAVLALGAAGGFPWLVRHLPWSVERSLGALAGAGTAGEPCRGGGPQARAALDELVRRLYPLLPGDEELPITVEVVRGREVNAFATLGGHIYVLEGLLAQAHSAEELAGVLAHEIEHVRQRHILQAVAMDLITAQAMQLVWPSGAGVDPRLAQLFLGLQFSRRQEAEADELGLERLRAAQVDAAGLAQFFARARELPEPPPFLNNHPSAASRQARAAGFHGDAVRAVLAPDQWSRLQALCR